jgi:alpha-tubulin suppressor-like RCC1 family protein
MRPIAIVVAFVAGCSAHGGKSVSQPATVSPHASAVVVDAGAIHDALFVATTTTSSHIYDACVVRGAGEVVCHSDSGAVRPGVLDATRVTVGHGHACALRSNGRVVCWGSNHHAQCGAASGEEMKTAHDVGVTDAIAIAAGGDATCALLRSGGVTCWGGNHWGQLGGRGDDAKHAQPSTMHGLADVVDLSLGFTHACAVRRSGEVVCWGNNLGRVANADTLDLKQPTRIGISDAIKVSAGSEATCAVRKSGNVTCVALSSSRGMDVLRGGGPYAEDQHAFDISGLAEITDVSVGDRHACALRRDGAVLCWGDNARGQIGDGTGPRIPHVMTVTP